MTESLKFGPEWLRNSISTSPTKQDDSISRPILSDCRFSKEEMLSFCDKNRISLKHPEVLPLYQRLYVPNWQTPLSFNADAEERERAITNGRLFLNSNIKHGAWRRSLNTEEKTDENWRTTPKEIGNSNGIFYDNKFSERVIKSWRSNENGTNGDQTHDQPMTQKSPIITLRNSIEKVSSNKPSGDTIKSKSLEKFSYNTFNESAIRNSTVLRQLFEGDKQETKLPEKQVIPHSVKRNDKDLLACDMQKLEADLLKDFTELSFNTDMESTMMKVKKPAPEKINISWFYLDPYGEIQGPFSEERMSLWYQNSFFHENLMVKRSIDANFITLGHLIKVYGSAHPFTVATNTFPIPKVDNFLEQLSSSASSASMSLPQIQPSVKFNITNQWNMHSREQQQQHQQVQHNQMHYMHSQYYPPPSHYQHHQPPPPQPSQMHQNIPVIDPRMMNTNTNPFLTTQLPPQPSHYHLQQQQQPYNTFHANSLNYQQKIQPLNQLMNVPPPTVQPPPPPRQMENNSKTMIDPIQKMLYEIQKHQEAQKHIQQQQQQQQQKQALLSQSNNNKINMSSSMIPSRQSIDRNDKHIFSAMDGIDGDDEGEFQKVENLRKKKFQKEIKEKPQQIKEDGNELHKVPITMKEPPPPLQLPLINHEPVKKVCLEEKSTLPAMPAPWIDKVINEKQSNSKNLMKIQIEEEEIRQIEMQMQYEKECELAKQEMIKQRTVSWNTMFYEDQIKAFDLSSQKSNNEKPELPQQPQPSSSTSSSGAIRKVITDENVTKNSKSLKQQKNPKINSNDKKNEFKTWCIGYLKKINANVDIPVFVSFLQSIDSPFEIEDYIKMYLGDSRESNDFLKNFLEHRSICRKPNKNLKNDDDLCAPAKAINPSSHDDVSNAQKKKKKTKGNLKKSKKFTKVLDANILNFKGAADPNRKNVGDIDDIC